MVWFNVQLPGCIGFFYKSSVYFLSPWLKDFVHAKGKLMGQRWAELCWKQKSTGWKRVQTWASLGTLTVLVDESGTVPLCFVCVPKKAFENAAIFIFLSTKRYLKYSQTIVSFFFSWKSSANSILICWEVWALKTLLFQRICWKERKRKKAHL